MNCVNSDCAACPEITDLYKLQLAPHSDPKPKWTIGKMVQKMLQETKLNESCTVGQTNFKEHIFVCKVYEVVYLIIN